jgi:probable F420-dependent oxidoreductase
VTSAAHGAVPPKFGLSLVGLSLRHQAEVAAHAEASGFESVWVGEHLLWPADIPASYPYQSSGRKLVDPSTPLYDPWVSMAHVAHATSRIRLGTNVYILPLRHPVITARAVTTLDHVSNGRVTLGAGAGWLEAEFDALGVPFSERGARFDECIEVLRMLWTTSHPEHCGPFYPFGPVRFEPKPRQNPGPPIEIGGTSPTALRRAATKGDGWIAIDSDDLSKLRYRIEFIHDLRRSAGRSDFRFEISLMSSRLTDHEFVAEAAACGVTRFIASPFATFKRPALSDFISFVSSYSAEVIAAFADERGAHH